MREMLESTSMTMLGLSSKDVSLVFMCPLIELRRIDSHVMSMLPIFHGNPSKVPYQHIDKLNQVCETNQFHNVPTYVMKIKFSPASRRDRAKDWFLKLEKDLTS